MVLLAVLFLAADVSTACTGYWFVAAAVVTYLIAAAIVHKNKFFCYFGIFFTFCIYCAFMTAQSENSSMIDMYNKTQAVITGTVSRINNTGYGKSITLKECEIKTEYGNSHENVIVYVNNDEVFIKEGFVIEVSGSIGKFEKARNEGMFDAYTYYKSNGIAYRCEAGKIVVTGHKNSIEYIMPEIKNKINNIYEKITDNETKGFLNAVILGDKSEIDDEMYELYRNNGIAHILAISGLHITFLASFVYNMLRKRGIAFFPAFGICALFLVFYSIMTGNSVSAKRAVIMYMVKMGAEFAGRTYDTLSSLAFAMIIICAENVNIIYNPGFLLSFTSIAGIAIFCPAVVKSMKKIIKTQNKYISKIIEMVSVSVGISIFMMPLIAYNYFEIPLYAPFLNLIIIPLMSVVILCAVAAVILSFISMSAASFIIGAVSIIIKLYTAFCKIINIMPYSRIITGRPEKSSCIIFYIILIIMSAAILNNKKIIMKKFPLIIIVSIIILFAKDTKTVEADFIDVGQGDSILVREKSGTVMLFDGGSSDIKNVGEKRIYPLIKCKGIKKIDYIFISHTDNDHINGIMELIELSGSDLKIKNIILPLIKNASQDENYNNIIKKSCEKGININYVNTGSKFNLKNDFSVTCIHPDNGYIYSDANDYSAVYILKKDDFKMLLTGDIEKKAEDNILKNKDVREELKNMTVLKAAHHGSASSSCEEFIKLVNPEVTVISCGINNRYGHPKESTLKMLKKYNSDIYVTKECGQVMIRYTKDKFYVKTL